MRIVFGTESYSPNVSGVAVTTANLGCYLAEKGHDVTIFAPAHTGIPRRESKDGVTIVRVPAVNNPFRRDFRVGYWPGRVVRPVFKQIKPDLVHLQDPASICRTLLHEANRAGCPVVASNHFNLDYVLSYVRWKWLHPFLCTWLSSYLVYFYNHCDFLTCPSRESREKLLALGVNVNCEVVSNGVSLNRFFSHAHPTGIRNKLGLPDRPIVLYVGRLDEDKNVDTIFNSIPAVLAQTPAVFVFCGSGNLRNTLENRVLKEGTQDRVFFLGPYPHDSEILPQLYQLALCLVMPSGIETQSIVTLEAMASGLPVVAAMAGALPELVSDGVNGLLFTYRDDKSLAEKITRLVNNPQLAAEMGRMSLQKVVQHNISESFRRIEQIYLSLVPSFNYVGDFLLVDS